jgi:hypothetical protein
MLPQNELEELAESIRTNGLRSPVMLTPDGLILDGRNRAAACRLAGIEPDTDTYLGYDLAEYVIDANITRRNMSTGARAMATALVLQAAGRRENGRWKRGSVDISESANNSGWKDRLKECGIVLDFKPDLAAAVVSGDLALDAAYQQANEIRNSEQRDQIMEKERIRREKDEAAAEAELNAGIVADLTMAGSRYAALIEDGTMTPAAAWAAHQEDTRKERERQAAERRNREQTVRDVCRSLAVLFPLRHDNLRASARRDFAECSDAVPMELLREYFIPETIRAVAGALTALADEIEEEPRA